MADLAGTYGFGTSPTINYTVSYTTKRTAVNTVTTSIKVKISAVSGQSYFGYNITGYVKVNGANGATQTLKNNSPNQWSAFEYTFPTITSTGVSATAQSFETIVYLSSSSGRSFNTGSRTVSFPIGNTAPYWSNGNITSSSYTKGSIIPENVSSLAFSWSGAKDDQGNPILYSVDPYINGTYWGNIGYDTTSTSATWTSANKAGEGAVIALRVYCRDANTAYESRYIQQNIFTKNTLTAASINENSSITFDSNSFYLKRTNASNTNGNTTFTYTLSCAGLTVHNNNVSSVGTTITVAIHRAGALPAGPYVLFSDLQSKFAVSAYKGTLTFTLSTKNAYNTTKSSSRSVSVDLQKLPTSPANLITTGAYTIGAQSYYVINRRGVTLAWDACTEPNNTSPVYYDVETNVDNGTWTRAATGLTSTSFTTPMLSRTSQGTLQIRIQSRTTYGTVSQWEYSPQLTIHYYYPPTVSGLSVDRSDTSKTSIGVIKKYTSISDAAYNLTIQFKNGLTVMETQTPSMNDEPYKFTHTKSGMSEAETYTETIVVSDSISTSVFGLSSPQTTATIIVPRYAAMLTIREKGVGINAVAGDFASFIANGTTSMFGGYPEGAHDSTWNVGVHKNSTQNFYVGCYRDSAGNYHSSHAIPLNPTIQHKFIQIQVVHPGQSSGASFNPVKWRTFLYEGSTNVELVQDQIFEPSDFGDWKTFVDTSNILNMVYPVGSIYMSVNNVSPQTFIGGTWAVWGTGRVPVGVDTTQTEFNTVQKTGGAKTHTLTTNEMPGHTHTQNAHSHTIRSNAGSDSPVGINKAIGGIHRFNLQSNGVTNDGNSLYAENTAATNQNAGGGQAHNNLQPYITCYMWRRTA